MTKEDATKIIMQRKRELGDKLVILGHHYQNDDIIGFADYVGDSLELARKSARINDAKIIVFCGVYFMAETAAVLAPDKMVYIPDITAGCPLADMAQLDDVSDAYQEIMQVRSSCLPITYVNSSVEIKAFCGRNGGTVCTSGNAGKVFEWAFTQSDAIFFMPDKNLGYNTAHSMGISPEEIVEWDQAQMKGGLDKKSYEQARVIVWNGWCPVHWPDITVKHVEKMRIKHPDIQIIVHPETDPKTVDASDVAGSTARILDFVKSVKPGSTIAIGTEYNMVKRAAQEYKDKVQIEPVEEIFCEDMARITIEKLALCLKTFDESLLVKVDEDTARDARIALERMLEI